MMSLSRVKARDRRKAAVHEAGHYVTARHFGVPMGRVWIMPHDGDPKTESTWVGHTEYHTSRLRRLSAIRRVMFASAGITAEAIWASRTRVGTDCLDELLEGLWDPAAMSETDWAMAECQPGEPDWRLRRAIEKVWALLDRELWPDLCRVSRQLITER